MCLDKPECVLINLVATLEGGLGKKLTMTDRKGREPQIARVGSEEMCFLFFINNRQGRISYSPEHSQMSTRKQQDLSG